MYMGAPATLQCSSFSFVAGCANKDGDGDCSNCVWSADKVVSGVDVERGS